MSGTHGRPAASSHDHKPRRGGTSGQNRTTKTPSAKKAPPKRPVPELDRLLALAADVSRQVQEIAARLDHSERSDAHRAGQLLEIDHALASLRRAHQSQIVRLDQVAHRAQNMDVVRSGLRTAMREAQIRKVETLEEERWFDKAPSDVSVGAHVILSPAYVDLDTDRLIQPGRLGGHDELSADTIGGRDIS